MKDVVLLLLLVLFGVPPQQDEIPVTWSLEMSGSQRPVKRGGRFAAELKASIEDGWHIYAISQPPPPKATLISLSAGQPFEMVEDLKAPESRKAFDENFGVDTEFYEGKVTFNLPLRVAATAPTWRTASDGPCLLSDLQFRSLSASKDREGRNQNPDCTVSGGHVVRPSGGIVKGLI